MQLKDIIANMRNYADRLDSVGGMPSPTDLRTFADGIDAAIREENHCKKRFAPTPAPLSPDAPPCAPAPETNPDTETEAANE